MWSTRKSSGCFGTTLISHEISTIGNRSDRVNKNLVTRSEAVIRLRTSSWFRRQTLFRTRLECQICKNLRGEEILKLDLWRERNRNWKRIPWNWSAYPIGDFMNHRRSIHWFPNNREPWFSCILLSSSVFTMFASQGEQQETWVVVGGRRHKSDSRCLEPIVSFKFKFWPLRSNNTVRSLWRTG